MQKNHIEYPQAKGSIAGFTVGGLILREALRRQYYEDLPSDAPLNIALDPETGLIRVTAIGGGIFMAAKEDVRSPELTKTEAVQATVTLTLPDNPTHGDDMDIGDQNYVFKDAILGTAKAILTLTGVITPGSHAESVVTANTIIDGSQITIGSRTYTFKTALTDPAEPDEVLIGGSDAVALDNLKLAINHGAGEGTNYSTGTVAHADVVATDNTDTTQKIVARVPGTAANALATTSLDATLSWPDTTLGGGTGASNPGVAPETVTVNDKTYSIVDVLSETNGAAAIINQVLFGADSAAALDNLKSAVNGTAGEGTTYSTGTEQPTDVEATTNTNTEQTFEALTDGAAANAYVSTTTIANGDFAAGTFEGGYDDDGKTIVIGNDAAATQTRVRAAINGTGTPGTDYSTALAANELVTCGAFASDDGVITAKASGTEGNGIAVAESFTSSNNVFSDTETSGGIDEGNFDAYIPAGQTMDFSPDEDVTQISFIAVGASTDIVVLEY